MHSLFIYRIFLRLYNYMHHILGDWLNGVRSSLDSLHSALDFKNNTCLFMHLHVGIENNDQKGELNYSVSIHRIHDKAADYFQES